MIEPGSVLQALVTGMFGIQSQPTAGEVLAWLLVRSADDDLRAVADAAAGIGRGPTVASAAHVAPSCCWSQRAAAPASGSGGGSDGGKVTEVSITNAGCQPPKLDGARRQTSPSR